jgi:enamidase
MSKFMSFLLHVLAVIVAFVVMLVGLFSIAYYTDLYTLPAEESPPLLVVTGATLIDGSGRPPVPNATIIISGDRLLRIQPDGVIPQDAQVLRLDGMVIIPALLDAAVYFEAPVGEELDYLVGEWTWEVARSLPEHRRALLEKGVCTVQDLGSGAATILRSRSLLDEAELAGPRLMTSGPILTAPESAWIQERYPFRPEETTLPVGTPQEGEHGVQVLAAEGVDLISVSYRANPRLELDTLEAIIRQAHGYGLRVVVETASLEEARQAVAAGADALVGGVSLAGEQVDGELLSMMVEQGTFYIPTLVAVEVRQGDWPDSLDTALLNTRLVNQAGVPVVAGSGAAGHELGILHDELALLVAAGLTPAEAIRAATFNAARLLQVDGWLGTVEENKLADLLVLGDSPLINMSALDKVYMVIQDGIIDVDQLSVPLD